MNRTEPGSSRCSNSGRTPRYTQNSEEAEKAQGVILCRGTTGEEGTKGDVEAGGSEIVP